MILSDHPPEIKNTLPSDPAQAAEFDQVLENVHTKYRCGVPLTRRELLRLAQTCITIAERGAAQ